MTKTTVTKIRPTTLQAMKQKSEQIVMLTAYDFLTAKILDEMDIDVILVGDSLGNVFSGYDSTLPVTMDHMVYHTQAVVRGASRSLVVADMPFLSYQISPEEARRNAGRLIQEGGAQAIKIEVGPQQIDCVKSIVNMGIPVMGHIGFTPQFIHQIGGFKVQGRDELQREELIKCALDLQNSGCFAILIEMVDAQLTKELLDQVDIPIIGIGAGICDGQVLVTQDVLGLSAQTPSFAKQYATINSDIKKAIDSYKADVKSTQFPSSNFQFN